MQQSLAAARVLRLGEVQPIAAGGGLYQPLRRLLGVRAFGINAYTAHAAGDQLIERHNELGAGSGHHEEAYIVLTGHARFAVGDSEIDAPSGTIVFVPDISVTRAAVALEANTTAIVVGAPADRPLPVSPFEYWFLAEEPYRRGDYQEAIRIVSEGLEQWPNHPVIHYQLACYHARAGMLDDALSHLESAIGADAKVREWALGDSDFDALRGDARFVALLGR